ncbi:DNA replication regulator SLD3-domain-containing protein [Pseudoneurospora amorphoporcata]|uniref:DNA replication regulator SLD3-domain-containing protein n=1 Tax=Pseudoneurospora amorphoporcata TaxID=241081 RepID=A0AAN6NV14_9PEZI|nr:DNA replication regulator SLD3-domain-containing protein [Pseudoneurospora amorphoporcata]
MSFSLRRTSGASRPTSSRSISAPTPSLTAAIGLAFPAIPASPVKQISPTRQSHGSPDVTDVRKRKREAAGFSQAGDGLLKASVVLKPHPSSLTDKPRILSPLMLLPREHLPLSALDLSQPQGDFPPSRFYESRIKILDLEGRLGSNILLARSEANRMLYAIERESDGLYTLCKLASWVDVDVLAQSATVVSSQRMKSCKPSQLEIVATGPLITPQMYKETKRRKLAIEEIQSSLIRKRSNTTTTTEQEPLSQLPTPVSGSPEFKSFENQSLLEPAEAPTVSNKPNLPAAPPHPTEDVLSQPTAEGIFQNIRMQYFEALYHSKGSLAYFAKGPLSRARAAFHLDCDLNLEMNDLIDFLRSLVMTTALIDKKYRETLPEVIGKMKTVVEDSDQGRSQSKPRKKRAKKLKLGKNGLYPSEEEHIERWWVMHKPSTIQDDGKMATAPEAKHHISVLRRRETQLQMIIILEILALEPLTRLLAATQDSQLPGMETQETIGGTKPEAHKKKNKTANLPLLVDMHADRLCIWQSTTLDEVKALTESQPSAGDQESPAEDSNSDPLRDFCVDIVVPFFSARLPKLCDSINRKLGGPVIQALKEKAKTVAASKPKPGAPAKRVTATKRENDRTLQRVLSNERMRRSVSRGPSGTIALLRSASATAIPGLKREGSEPLLGMIPKNEAVAVKEKNVSIFSRTAGSLANNQDAKAEKKARLEAELKEAISALKKPNRALAGKEIVEEAERRTAQPKSKLNKKQPRAAGVQVKATPANNRFKDVFAKESQPLHLDHLLEKDGPAIPSSASVVPASTLPRKFTNVFATSTTPNASGASPSSKGGNEVGHQLPPRKQVQETPLRKKSIPHISLPQIDEEEVEEATPVLPSKNVNVHVQVTPMRKQRFTQQKLPVPRPDGHLQVQVQAQRLATTPQRKRQIQGTPMRHRKSLQSLPQIVEEDDPLTHSIPSSSPIFAKRSTVAPTFNRAVKQQHQQQQQYLVPPTPLGNRSSNKGAAAATTTTGADFLPSSPGFAFIETPLNNAKSKTVSATTAGVVDDTPIKSRLSAFTSIPGAGASEHNHPFSSSSSRQSSRGGGGVPKIKKEKDTSPVSIYQRLGWDDTDDDLA